MRPMSFRVGERVASSSADRMRRLRRSRAEEKKAQDREADAASARKRRAALAEDEKAQDRAINAAFQRDKRESSYADHRAHIETSLRTTNKN